jgi:hypothetical protein
MFSELSVLGLSRFTLACILPPKTGSSCPKGSARLVCARKEDMTRDHRTFGRRRRKSLLRRLVTTALLFSTCLIIYFILTSWEKHREVSVASGRVSASVSLAAPSSMFSADLASPWANHCARPPRQSPLSRLQPGQSTVDSPEGKPRSLRFLSPRQRHLLDPQKTGSSEG